MCTIEFADIRIRAVLPLHPYLYNHPNLFLRLLADESVCGDTAGVDGDLANGVWEFSTGLYAKRVKQSLRVAVLTGVKGPGVPVVSITLGVADLLARVKTCRTGHLDFAIFDSGTPIQLKLVMTCSIKLSSVLDAVLNDAGNKDHAINRCSGNNQPDGYPEKMNFSSRERLEASYKTTARTPDGDEGKARALSKLGDAYLRLYDEEHRKGDLEKAVSIHEEAMRLTGLFHPHLAEHTCQFAMALLKQFTQSSSYTEIERAISYFQTALRFTEDLDETKPLQWNNLGVALRLRFNRFGHLVDLENSILCQREAIVGLPDGHPNGPKILNNLGLALQFRFKRLGGLADLDDAISNHQQAVQITQDSHPDKPRLLNNLGIALGSRFERLDGLADLDDAVSSHQQAVQLSPHGHSGDPTLSRNFGLALLSRFERLGMLADLKDSISNLHQAAQFMPDDHLHKPSLFSSLGLALQSRFKRLGGLADLEDAISNHQQAAQLTPDGHADRPGQFTNLGIALRSRFERLGCLADLEDAISSHRQAVQLTPDGHDSKPSQFDCLGCALRSRFERLGGLADLEEAISNHWQAVELTPDDHPYQPFFLGNLGIALQCRFQRLGGLADMEVAIVSHRTAVQLMPDGHADKPGRFGILGSALHCRFERLGGLADLEDAISNLQQAVQLMPDSCPSKLSLFENLGLALQSRFGRLGNLADLEGAISNHQRAVQLSPDGHADTPGQFTNLGIALRSRFERLGCLADLEDAISNLQQGVQLTPDGHPNKPSHLHHLASALESRFRRLGILDDRESALSTLSTAANSVIGSAMVRLKAARAWAILSQEHSRSPLDAFSCAINLLPRIAWLGLSVTDQHALLANVGDIVHDAVAAAIRYKKYETAVVWAEQGRSIVWQNILGLRSPIEDLHEAQPELADRLHIIAKQIEGSGPHLEVPIAPAGGIFLNYSTPAIKWDDIIEEVRRIPRFENFLKAKSFQQLAPAAHEGPVVILNVNDMQCDAIVLISDASVELKASAVHIPLEGFSYEKSRKMFKTLTELLSSAGVRERNDRKTGRVQSQADGETKFKTILRILWQDVVKPVIEGLAFPIESERPPRIWWCATGLLAFLPIHAAGLYDTQTIGDKVSDYVVSSYTPTLNAILNPPVPMVQDDFQVLTVAQASAPGAQPIPKTEDEVRIIHGLTAGARRVNLIGKDATVDRVRKEMIQSNWIHLACHGKQSSDNPMESGFLLHDRMLKLSEIVNMSLPKADFAFLSACQTAMGNEKIAEESVHLAAGMLLSGCRGVIATTWSIRDEDGPKIAEDVYGRIFKDGKPNRNEAAYALHEAVKRLRDSGAKCTSWVPFIHIGR